MRILPFITLCSLLFAGTAQASDDVVIFLHNAWYEGHKNGEAHPKFGAYDFEGIKAALSQGGKVIAPVREANADASEAAEAVVRRIEKLIADGTPADRIKVIGASKGGVIAERASVLAGNPDIRWVLVGGCRAPEAVTKDTPSLTGKVLSIHEQSDKIAEACAKSFAKFGKVERFEETFVATGKGHGFQFGPDEAWIKPALSY